MPLDDADRRLLNRAQDDLPHGPAPFAALGAELGMSEAEVIARLAAMRERGEISRVGPLLRADGMGGGLALAAMAVPACRFEEVAEFLGAMPEVAHNYERRHELNMWFVLATETPAELARAVDRIERGTGLRVWAFPKEREYYLDLRLAV